MPEKEKTDPVAVSPIKSATMERNNVVTRENKIAKINFTVTNCWRVQPSIIFWRCVLKLNSFVSNIIKRMPGK